LDARVAGGGETHPGGRRHVNEPLCLNVLDGRRASALVCEAGVRGRMMKSY
jgi:hypothetical protein